MYEIRPSRNDREVAQKMLEFARLTAGEHNGLYVTKFDFADDIENSYMRLYMDLLMERFETKDDSFQNYFGYPFQDIPVDALLRHSVDGDGSIVVDRKKRVVDDHRYFNHVRGDILRQVKKRFHDSLPEDAFYRDLKFGSGHNFLQFGSFYPGVTTFACSSEKGTVTVYKKGKPVLDLFYKPPARDDGSFV